MGSFRIRLTGAAAALALALGAPVAAHADAFSQIFHAYQRTGKIAACKFTQAQLQQALDHVPNDIEAYAPDFANALQSALEQRSGGACDAAKGGAAPPAGTGGAPTAPGAASTTTTPPPPGATVTPAPAPDPTASAAASDQQIARTAQQARSSDAGAPAPVVALGIIGGLLALGGLAYALAFWLAWDSRGLRRARHAVGEAGWRAGNTWSEFADWVRAGR